VLLAIAGGLSVLLGTSPDTATTFLAWAFLVVVFGYLAFYAVGVFDVGCAGSLMLASVAAVCAHALQHAVVKGLSALTGG
jgi:hypothetical protein